MMENEYQTKDMKATTEAPKVEAPKVIKEGELYEEGGRWKFKLGTVVYQYKTKELATAGLDLLNG